MTLVLLAMAINGVSAQQLLGCGAKIPAARVAFQDGEQLKYAVAYSAPLINAEVADITFTTTTEKYKGADCYKIVATGVTRPFYAIFFPLNDTYTSWLNGETLRPLKATSNLHEGNYRYRTAMDFDYAALKVRTEGHNIVSRKTRNFVMPIGDCSYDAISLFYNMRSADLSVLQTSGNQKLSLALEDTVRSINFRFIGREIRKMKGVGEFRTVKFACQFATTSDESFHDGAEFFLWLSDDDNRIPIYLESPIKVGKVYAKLTQWENLKYPFSSIIIKN